MFSSHPQISKNLGLVHTLYREIFTINLNMNIACTFYMCIQFDSAVTNNYCKITFFQKSIPEKKLPENITSSCQEVIVSVGFPACKVYK